MGVPLPFRKTPPAVAHPAVLPQKRPAPAMDDSYFKKNYSAVAAAAAAAATEEEEVDEEEEEEEDERGESEEEIETSDGITEDEGIRKLAKAIKRFGEIYERVEGMKQRQMVELEKQRMQFAKDLEVQRMQLYMDTQVQLEKIKQSKRSGSPDDLYS